MLHVLHTFSLQQKSILLRENLVTATAELLQVNIYIGYINCK